MEKRSSRGFTLVEVIVVLVILGILAAILIPTCITYIQKAEANSYITECRQCVLAAQTLAVERYADDGVVTLAEDQSEILTLAEVPSGSSILSLVMNDEKATVKMLVYQSASSTIVTYADNQYTIGLLANLGQTDVRDALLTTMKGIGKNLDSEALKINGSFSSGVNQALKDAGLNLSSMGATSWWYDKDHSMFYWTTVDISQLKTDSPIPMMRYNANLGTYTVWIGKVATGSTDVVAGSESYNTLRVGSAYAPSTTQSKDQQTYDNMQDCFQAAMTAYKDKLVYKDVTSG